MKKKNDLTLKEALTEMIREYRIGPQLHETRVRALWGELMGKTIATYTSDIRLRKNVLYLTILSAPLRQELGFAKDKIRSLLNEHLGEDYIQDVVLR
jgi:hypothetical protein